MMIKVLCFDSELSKTYIHKYDKSLTANEINNIINKEFNTKSIKLCTDTHIVPKHRILSFYDTFSTNFYFQKIIRYKLNFIEFNQIYEAEFINTIYNNRKPTLSKLFKNIIGKCSLIDYHSNKFQIKKIKNNVVYIKLHKDYCSFVIKGTFRNGEKYERTSIQPLHYGIMLPNNVTHSLNEINRGYKIVLNSIDITKETDYLKYFKAENLITFSPLNKKYEISYNDKFYYGNSDDIVLKNHKFYLKDNEPLKGNTFEQICNGKTECIHIKFNTDKSLIEKPIKLFIKTLTGKTFEINICKNYTIHGIKRAIFDIEGIPTDQQRLAFAGKQLEDEFTVSNYNIVNESVMYLILRLRGGGGAEFIDLTKGFKKTNWSTTKQPSWRMCDKGVFYTGYCKNIKCITYNDYQCINKHYEPFDLIKDKNYFKCNECDNFIDCISFGANNCILYINGETYDGQVIKKKEKIGDYIYKPLASEKNVVLWKYLKIWSEPINKLKIHDNHKTIILEKNQICPICYDKLDYSARITNCNHVFCNGCIKEWKRKSSSCPLCRSELT